MRAGDGERRGQAQSGTSCFGGVKGFEQAFACRFQKSRSAVNDTQTCLVFSQLQNEANFAFRTGGNKSEAARLLAIDYKTLLRKLAS